MPRIEHNSKYGAQLIADVPHCEGELVCRIEEYRVVESPTYQTIQVGAGQHLEELGMVAYMNHSCQPNTLIDTSTLTVIAARNIAAGEGLTFFYPSTEWEMERPFVCLCGAAQCIGIVAGARFLPVDVLSRYFINRHVREMIGAQLMQSSAAVVPLVPALAARPVAPIPCGLISSGPAPDGASVVSPVDRTHFCLFYSSEPAADPILVFSPCRCTTI
jgi:hypothetical protein